MQKNNLSRDELLEFINGVNSQQLKPAEKIQDLSSGVHYLYLLGLIEPQIVRMNKVNTKAYHEYENIQNLKILANYLQKARSNFLFDLPKLAKRNFQENLNLLKNLHKMYCERFDKSEKKESKVKSSRETILINNNGQKKVKVNVAHKAAGIELHRDANHLKKRQTSKMNLPSKSVKSDTDQTLKAIQKIKSIQVAIEVEEQQSPAELVLQKIKKILNLQNQYSAKKKSQQRALNKRKNAPNSRQKVIFSEKLQEQKTAFNDNENMLSIQVNFKNDVRCDSKEKDLDQKPRSEVSANCQLSEYPKLAYNLRPKSNRMSFCKNKSTMKSVQQWLAQQEDENSKYNQNLLLSPDPAVAKVKEQTALRTENMRKAEQVEDRRRSIIKQFDQPRDRRSISRNINKSVHFSPKELSQLGKTKMHPDQYFSAYHPPHHLQIQSPISQSERMHLRSADKKSNHSQENNSLQLNEGSKEV